MVEPISTTGLTRTATNPQQQQSQQQQILAWMQRWWSIMALLLRVLLGPLRLAVRWVFPPGEWDGLAPAVTAKAAKQFVAHLQRLGVAVTRQQAAAAATTTTTATNNNNDHSTSLSSSSSNDDSFLWTNSSGFTTVQQEALEPQHPCMVLVYLHSPLHGQADAACRNFLGHGAVVDFLRQPNVKAFGCSIHTGQGAQLAHWLSASAFPLVALLQPKRITGTTNTNNNTNGSSNSSNNNMSLVYKAEGPLLLQMISNNNSTTSITQLMIPYWMSALQRFQSQMAEQEARRIQRQQEQELRRQQDEEYQETLRQDQARQLQLQEEQESERRRLQDEQDAIQRQVHEEKSRLETAKALMREEPTAGDGTRIRFVLPTGTKLDRSFHSDQTVKSLKAFLFLHFQQQPPSGNNNNKNAIVNIGLSTNFPKKTFSKEDDDKTLQEVGLAPQAVLMVQDLDA